MHHAPGSAEDQRLAKDPSRAATGWAVKSYILSCWSGTLCSALKQEPINLFSRPELRQEHPLNLSISISGGKETNKDSLSNGE